MTADHGIEDVRNAISCAYFTCLCKRERSKSSICLSRLYIVDRDPMSNNLGVNKTVRDLVRELAAAAASPMFCDRIATSAFLCARLRERIQRLSDRQIAQLNLDLVLGSLPVFSPESAIVGEAIHRLFLSARSAPVDDERDLTQAEQPACPRCDREMVLHFGIEEPDYLLCQDRICGYARSVQGSSK